MILFILDLIGSYQGILNLKSTRKRNFEWLHFLWQVVQNYKFAKSQEKPHKMLILNREVRPPTLNFWYFFWFRMVPYGPNINVPGFPKFFSWKVAFLQHSNVQWGFFWCTAKYFGATIGVTEFCCSSYIPLTHGFPAY